MAKLSSSALRIIATFHCTAPLSSEAIILSNLFVRHRPANAGLGLSDASKKGVGPRHITVPERHRAWQRELTYASAVALQPGSVKRASSFCQHLARRRSFASQVMEKHTGSEMLGEACPGQQVGSAARHNREREDFLEIAPLLTPTIAKKSRPFQRRSELKPFSLENSRIADSAADPRGPRGGLRSQQRISTEVTGS
ncbi:hypothetical protein NDA11_004831 [Ustilago hordei]|uniref:Uncharacterized protein n=1 Tax=Ustilago hordei TaxID=120017 RepID=I2G631_USTHO|nr:hypothetical protein NDA10_006101 [Ustilago hordei]KAJ1586184.1 hypothetical protein NDA12_005642 [Ustilago hordei]KAJ1589650.1 hypothetical protein NDA15_007506 [Ustilago hordei]KAJ1590986.1 hypothetical protein NDA11_004831 [Ustilago hordei]KAJ1600889.1 hypothetical protein NDA14_004732 [Ustilago hordei]